MGCHHKYSWWERCSETIYDYKRRCLESLFEWFIDNSFVDDDVADEQNQQEIDEAEVSEGLELSCTTQRENKKGCLEKGDNFTVSFSFFMVRTIIYNDLLSQAGNVVASKELHTTAISSVPLWKDEANYFIWGLLPAGSRELLNPS